METTKHPEFAVHALNKVGKDRAAAIADALDELTTKLEGYCNHGRDVVLGHQTPEQVLAFMNKMAQLKPSKGDHQCEKLYSES